MQPALVEAGRLAERAITLDPQDAKALTIAGHVRAFLHHQLHEAVALHERALLVNPNLAMAWALSSVAHAYLGDFDEAARRNARYKQLSPYDPQAFYFDTSRIIVALLRHDHTAAVAAGREVTQMNPAFSAALKPYAAALGHLGIAGEMQSVRERLLAMEPDFSVDAFINRSPFERSQDREHYRAGLLLAGLPA